MLFLLTVNEWSFCSLLTSSETHRTPEFVSVDERKRPAHIHVFPMIFQVAEPEKSHFSVR